MEFEKLVKEFYHTVNPEYYNLRSKMIGRKTTGKFNPSEEKNDPVWSFFSPPITEKEKVVGKPSIVEQFRYIADKRLVSWSSESDLGEIKNLDTLKKINIFEEIYSPLMVLPEVGHRVEKMFVHFNAIPFHKKSNLKKMKKMCQEELEELIEKKKFALKQIEIELNNKISRFRTEILEKVEKQIQLIESTEKSQDCLTERMKKQDVRFNESKSPLSLLIDSCQDAFITIFSFLETTDIIHGFLISCSYFFDFIRNKIPLRISLKLRIMSDYPFNKFLETFQIRSLVFRRSDKDLGFSKVEWKGGYRLMEFLEDHKEIRDLEIYGLEDAFFPIRKIDYLNEKEKNPRFQITGVWRDEMSFKCLKRILKSISEMQYLQRIKLTILPKDISSLYNLSVLEYPIDFYSFFQGQNPNLNVSRTELDILSLLKYFSAMRRPRMKKISFVEKSELMILVEYVERKKDWNLLFLRLFDSIKSNCSNLTDLELRMFFGMPCFSEGFMEYISRIRNVKLYVIDEHDYGGYVNDNFGDNVVDWNIFPAAHNDDDDTNYNNPDLELEENLRITTTTETNNLSTGENQEVEIPIENLNVDEQKVILNSFKKNHELQERKKQVELTDESFPQQQQQQPQNNNNNAWNWGNNNVNNDWNWDNNMANNNDEQVSEEKKKELEIKKEKGLNQIERFSRYMKKREDSLIIDGSFKIIHIFNVDSKKIRKDLHEQQQQEEEEKDSLTTDNDFRSSFIDSLLTEIEILSYHVKIDKDMLIQYGEQNNDWGELGGELTIEKTTISLFLDQLKFIGHSLGLEIKFDSKCVGEELSDLYSKGIHFRNCVLESFQKMFLKNPNLNHLSLNLIYIHRMNELIDGTKKKKRRNENLEDDRPRTEICNFPKLIFEILQTYKHSIKKVDMNIYFNSTCCSRIQDMEKLIKEIMLFSPKKFKKEKKELKKIYSFNMNVYISELIILQDECKLPFGKWFSEQVNEAILLDSERVENIISSFVETQKKLLENWVKSESCWWDDFHFNMEMRYDRHTKIKRFFVRS